MKKTPLFLSLAALTCIGTGTVVASGTGWSSSPMQSVDSLWTEEGDTVATPDVPEDSVSNTPADSVIVDDGKTLESLNEELFWLNENLMGFSATAELNDYGKDLCDETMNIVSRAMDSEDIEEKSSLLSIANENFRLLRSLNDLIVEYYKEMETLNGLLYDNAETIPDECWNEFEELASTDISNMDENSLSEHVGRVYAFAERISSSGSGGENDDPTSSDSYFVVQAFDSWTSQNHDDNSSSSNVWKINSSGQDKIVFEYAVSSESGCDWLTVTLTSPSGQSTQLVRVSGTQSARIEQNLPEKGEYTLEAQYSKDGSVNTGTDDGIISSLNHLMSDPVAPAKEYLATIETSFPVLAAELSTAIGEAEAADDDNRVAVYAQLSSVMGQVSAAVDIYPSLTTLIEQANTLIETLQKEIPELMEALSQASDVNPETSASTAYLPAYEDLKYQVRLASASVVPMDAWAFDTSREYTVDGLKYYLDTEHGIAQFNGINGTWNQSEFVLPAVITVDGDAYTVVSMENRYRHGQDSITSVVLPLSLRRIGQYAFWYFRSLTSLDVPANVEVFGSEVFYGCDNENISIKMNPITPPACEGELEGYSKKKITVPDGTLHAYRLADKWTNCVIVEETPITVTVDVADPGELGRLVLDQAGYLQEVNKLVVSGELNNDDWTNIKNMSNLVAIDMSGLKNTSVPNRQFYGKWAMDEAVISGKCATIGDYAFYQTGLKEVVIPEGVETIGYEAFYQCDKAATLTLPSTLKSIGGETFRKMSKIEAVEIPNSVTSVGTYAFEGCSSLRDVKLSESLTVINEYMLCGTAIERIDIPESVTDIKRRAFENCASLDSVVCPSSLKYIRNYAFVSCSSLKSIEMNEGLTTIEGYAFRNCKALTEITLPSSLIRCVEYPFYGCSNLKKIYARSIIPATTNGYCPLYNVPLNDVVLYVPTWSVQEYQLADGWNQFMTVETHDFMPENIYINKDFVFALRDTLAADYRPNIALQWSSTQSEDAYGNTNYEKGNLTINSRSKLPVNDFSLYVSPYEKYYEDYRVINNSYSWNSSGRQYSSTSLIVNGEMRAENVTLNLLARRSTWQFISFPFDVQMSDIVPVDSITQWVIREYSGENRANNRLDSTWVNVPSDATLSAGKGYILHCYNPNSELVQFTVSPLRESVNRQAIFISTDRIVALEENLSEFEHNRSWNLIGNPYPSYYDSRYLDFDAPITVWNTYENNYRAYSPVDDAYILSPGEAFFVQRPVEQEAIVFEKAGRQTHTYARTLDDEPSAAAARRMAAPARSLRQVININLNGEDASDRTRVVLNNDASMDYELNRDASKFMSMDSDVPQLFSIQNGVRYAINERPVAEGEVVLGVIVKKAGVYTIALPENDTNEYVIEDLLMNSTSSLRADHPFEFTAEPGDMEGRFVLRVVAQGDATAIETVAGENGQDDEPAYNMAGQAINPKHAKGIVVKKNRKFVK